MEHALATTTRNAIPSHPYGRNLTVKEPSIIEPVCHTAFVVIDSGTDRGDRLQIPEALK